MNNKRYIIIGLIAVIIGLIAYIIINNREAEPKNETANTEEHHDHGAGLKKVELNPAQYRNAEVELGWFEQKNLSEVVNANGYTKLPPQNQADVSVFTTGLVKTIKVLEGQAVKKGQTLAIIESPEFAVLQADYLTSKSNLAYLEKEFERQDKLNQEDVNARKVFEKTKADLETEKARFNSLSKQLAVLNINGDGAPVATIPIRAPITGHITEVYVNIGSSVEPGKPLFSIVDNSEMHVDLLVYEKDLYKVKKDQNVRFVLTNQSNKEINGSIFNIGKSFENETKTVAVHAHIEDKGEDLIPGMYVNALIDVGSSVVRTLPEEAVVQAEGRNFIFVLEKTDAHDGHSHGNKKVFRRVEVSTGPSQLGFIQVTPVNKIKEGEKIVVNGAYYLQSHLQKSEGGGGHHH